MTGEQMMFYRMVATCSRPGDAVKPAPSSPSGFAGSSFMKGLVLALMATSGMAREIATCSSNIARGIFRSGDNLGVLNKLATLTSLNKDMWDQMNLGVNTSSVALQLGDNHLGDVAQAYAASVAICTAGTTIPERNLLIANTIYEIYADASGPYISDFDSALPLGNLTGMEVAMANGLGITIQFPSASPSGPPIPLPSDSPSASPSPSPTVTVTFNVPSPSPFPSPGATASPPVRIDVGGYSCYTTLNVLRQSACDTLYLDRVVEGYIKMGCPDVSGGVTITCNPDGSGVRRALTAGDNSTDVFHIVGNGTIYETAHIVSEQAVAPIKEDVAAQDVKIETNTIGIRKNETTISNTTAFTSIVTALGVVGVLALLVYQGAKSRLCSLATRALESAPDDRKEAIIGYAGDPKDAFQRDPAFSPFDVFKDAFLGTRNGPTPDEKARDFSTHKGIALLSQELGMAIKGAGTRKDARAAANVIVLTLLAKLQEMRAPGLKYRDVTFADQKLLAEAVHKISVPSASSFIVTGRDAVSAEVGGALGIFVGGMAGGLSGGDAVILAGGAIAGLAGGGVIGAFVGKGRMDINLEPAFAHLQFRLATSAPRRLTDPAPQSGPSPVLEFKMDGAGSPKSNQDLDLPHIVVDVPVGEAKTEEVRISSNVDSPAEFVAPPA